MHMEDSSETLNENLLYTIVRSSSTGFASATNKLSAWVTMRMEDDWTPLGPPQMSFVNEKWHIIQAMTK